MNNRGQIAILGVVFLSLLAIPFLFGGGLTGAWNLGKVILDVTSFMKSIPSFIWIGLGVLVLLKMIGGKK